MTGRRSLFLVVPLTLTLAGMFVPAPAQDPKPADHAPAFEVEKHTDIAYRTDPDADKVRHTLDVYVPKGQKDFPTVMFVHGGSWKSGNKNIYTGFGEIMARAGLGVVICNYRLSPKVQHPAHIEDVAKAFAWTYGNIGKYGGSTEKLFVCGHSAGGHLVALLATDETYLKAEKRSPADIKGVVAVSGVYRISPIAVFKGPFGTDEAVCKQASPLSHVTGKHPPFLIAYAETDFPTLDEMARDMHAALKKAGCASELLECKKKNHITIVAAFANPDDELHKSFREFVQTHSKPK